MSGAIRWWWVRHAPVAGLAGVLHGRDAPADLSDGPRLAQLSTLLPTDSIWLVSDLRRADDTYRALKRANPAIPAPQIDRDFGEQQFGLWTGLRWDQVPQADQDVMWSDPVGTRPPEGESFADLAARVQRRVRACVQTFDAGDIVMIGHAGPIRAALALASDGDLAAALTYRIDHLSVTRIDSLQTGTDCIWRVADAESLSAFA